MFARSSKNRCTKSRRKTRSRPRIHYNRYFPLLESLEDRTAPAVFNVNTTLDTVAVNLVTGEDGSGNISLRSALMAANATAAPDTINLPPGAYTLTRAGINEDLADTGDLDITEDVTIIGDSASTTVIDADQLDRVFETFAGVTANISKVTIRNGLVTGEGGGIANAGDLTLTETVLSSNEARGEAGTGSLLAPGAGGSVNGFGGGVYNTGNLTIVGSTLSQNIAQGGQGGGNQSFGSGGGGGGMGAGGGVFNDGGTVTISTSTISSNLAIGGDGQNGGPGGGAQGFGGGGGGLGGDGGEAETNDNNATGGSFGGGGGGGGSGGEFFDGGDGGDGGFGGGGGGGGNAQFAQTPGALGLAGFGAGNGGGGGNRPGFSGGGGGGGGGGLGAGGALFQNSGTIQITNSTISGNTALGGDGGQTEGNGAAAGGDGGDGLGGGFFAQSGAATFTNVTVAANAAVGGGGGGLFGGGTNAAPGSDGGGGGGGVFQNGGTVNVGNTLIGDNGSNGGIGPDAAGTLNSLGHNLVENTSDATIIGDLTGNITGVDPLLDSLQDNGGPTSTQGLFLGSPAIDAGNDALAPVTDQRGFSRVGTSDIGAYEAHPFLVTNTNDSGVGSLRQAIIDNNATSGGNTISFQIGAQGSSQTIAVLASGGISLPIVTKPVIIDGWSQGGPGYKGPPLIEIDGADAQDASSGSDGFVIQADNVEIRGLGIFLFPFFNTFGGTAIEIQGDNVWIYGNVIGETGRGNDNNGILIVPDAINALVGSDLNGVDDAAEANFISGNSNNAVEVQGDGNDVVDNQIFSNSNNGVLVSGNLNIVFGNDIDGNSNNGVHVLGDNNGIADNVITGNSGDGVRLDGSANIVVGNLIGLTSLAPLQFRGNSGAGVFVSGSNNIIGTIAAGDGNHIADNGFSSTATGVHVAGGTGNSIRGNSIFNNIGLGIDLGATSGQTANDPGDADSGANNLQNFPDLAEAIADNNNLKVTFGVLTDPGNAAYPLDIDFYTADANSQEGEVYLGSVTYSASEFNSAKTVSFASLQPIAPGDRILATATDAGGNTSEFSEALIVIANSAPSISGPEDSDEEGLIVGLGDAHIGTGTVTDPDSNFLEVTANYGDGSSPVNIPVDDNNEFSLEHAYGAEGTFTVTLTVTDDLGAVGQTTFFVHVLPAPPLAAEAEETENGIATATIPGQITATLIQKNPRGPKATLVVAVLPTELPSANNDPDQVVKVFDVRVINGNPEDTVVVTFVVDSIPGVVPVVKYINAANQLHSISGSTKLPFGLIIRQIPGTTRFLFTLTIDDTSAPKMAELLGTVFTFTVPRGPVLSNVPILSNLFARAQGQLNLASSSPQAPSGGIPTTDFAGGAGSELSVSSSQTLTSNRGGSGAGDAQDQQEEIVSQILEMLNAILEAFQSMTSPTSAQTPGDSEVEASIDVKPIAGATDVLEAVFSEFGNEMADDSPDFNNKHNLLEKDVPPPMLPAPSATNNAITAAHLLTPAALYCIPKRKKRNAEGGTRTRTPCGTGS